MSVLKAPLSGAGGGTIEVAGRTAKPAPPLPAVGGSGSPVRVLAPVEK